MQPALPKESPKTGMFIRYALASGVASLCITLVTAALSIGGVIGVMAARLMLFSAWLVVVLGVGTAEHFAEASRKRKIIVTIIVALVVAVPMVFFDRMVLYAEIEKQNAEIMKDILITIHKPSSGNVMGSVITATNGSTTIIGKHRLGCRWVQLDTPNNPGILRGGIGAVREGQTERLAPGDLQSEVCITPFGLPDYATCADLIVTFSYWLEADPSKERRKQTRFVTRMDHGILDWYGQPVSHPMSYCPTPPSRSY